jgi:HrpA-like RNA helicase
MPADGQVVKQADAAKYSSRVLQLLRDVDQAIIDYGLIEASLLFIMKGNAAAAAGLGIAHLPLDGAVLIFLPGMGEITKLNERLRENGAFRSLHVIPLHSEFSSKDQKQIFEPPPAGKRKVVLATNIAETSITIEDVTVVIDTGRVKEMRYDGQKRLAVLEETWVSQASGVQRMGRAGRTRPGVAFRLYSRALHDTLFKAQTTPEIRRVPLEDLILQIELLQLGTPEVFLSKAVTPPKPTAIAAALLNLHELAAIEPNGQGGLMLTPLGFHLSMLPIDVRLGKMLVYACVLQCVEPILTIAATMSNKSPFQAPFGKQQQADAAKRRVAGPGEMSDHLMWWRAYEGYGARFRAEIYTRGSVIEFHAFVPLEALACV